LNHSNYSRLISSDSTPVIDLMYFGDLETLPGFSTHAIKAFLGKDDENNYVLERIHIAGTNISPTHPNWSLAKIHLLSAMDNHMLFYDHAVLHINNNYVEAAAKKYLSPDNPLRLFLEPHFGFTVALDENILQILLKHTNPGNPLGFPIKSVFEIMKKGFSDYSSRGIDQDYVDTPFNKAQQESYNVLYDHCSNFVDNNIDVQSSTFNEIRKFSEEVRKIISWFPPSVDITPDLLKRILTRIFHEGCFLSSTDHIVTYSDLHYFRSIYRVRQPFSEDATWTMHDVFSPIDTYQRIVFRKIFSGEKCDYKLIDVEYHPSLQIDNAKFKKQLLDLEAKYPNIFPINRISAFIDI